MSITHYSTLPRLFGLLRVAIVATVAFCLVVVGPISADDELKQTEVVRGPGNWPITFSYYAAFDAAKKPEGNKNASVVMLIHGEGSERLFWDKTSSPAGVNMPFAKLLQEQGYAVLSIDMRKHGESAPEQEVAIDNDDYGYMVGDLVAIKEFLYKEHQAERLNMRKLAIVALDKMAPVATTYAEYDWKLLPYDDHPISAEATPRGQDVRALVLVSPELNAGKVKIVNSLKFLGSPAFGIAFQVIVGKEDRRAVSKANSVFKMVGNEKGAEDRTEMKEFETKEQSDKLFANRAIGVELPIVEFLKKNVKDLKIEWRDRRSRLDRE